MERSCFKRMKGTDCYIRYEELNINFGFISVIRNMMDFWKRNTLSCPSDSGSNDLLNKQISEIGFSLPLFPSTIYLVVCKCW